MANFSSCSEWADFISHSFLKAMSEMGAKVAEAFKRDVQPNVPFLHGDLLGGMTIQITQSGNQITIVIIWDTPYAQRQYWEHTSKSEWDVKTWEANKEIYSQIIVQSIIDNLGG